MGKRRQSRVKDRKWKRCSRCKQTRLTRAFGINRSACDGLQGWCRTCVNEYAREHRPLSKPLKRPSKTQCSRGRPSSLTRVRKLQGTPAGDVIEAMLRYTMWPAAEIARMARCHRDTVYRIGRRAGLAPRPKLHRRTLYSMDQAPVLRHQMFDKMVLLAAQKKDLLHFICAAAQKRGSSAQKLDRERTRKSIYRRLKGKKRRKPRRTRHYSTTGLFSTENAPFSTENADIDKLTDWEISCLLLMNIFSAVLNRPENRGTDSASVV